jgi:anthranilate/para-aminobenzoate synthase component II
MPNPFSAIRYHSLAVQIDNLPECLEITAWSDTNIAMGLRHRQFPIYGVQFHPESIMTQDGKKLLKNFLKMGGKP